MPTRLLTILLALITCAGCAKQNRSSDSITPEPAGMQSPHPKIDYLDLQVRPDGIDLDNSPGDEGVQVKLYLWRNDAPLAARLQRGVIEFLLYEGMIEPNLLAETQPTRAWRYTAAEMERFSGVTSFGVGYTLPLLWRDEPPDRRIITLSVRLLDPESGNHLYAKPLLFAVDGR